MVGFVNIVSGASDPAICPEISGTSESLRMPIVSSGISSASS